MLTLIADVEQFDEMYIATIKSIKGLVVQADSLEDVCHELLISLKVKLAHDLGIDIKQIKQTGTKNEIFLDWNHLKFSEDGSGKKEINLNLDMSLC